MHTGTTRPGRARLLVLIVATIALASTSCTWIVRVSVTDTGGQTVGVVSSVDVSHDGRFVVFVTTAPVWPGDTNGYSDVYVRDTAAGTTTAITNYNASSFQAVISNDASTIAFVSGASDIVAGDTNGTTDVFLYDTSTGTTTRASVSTLGVQSNGPSNNPSLTDDGSVVAFQSDATNLAAVDTNGATDIFTHNGASTSLVSRTDTGTLANGDSTDAAISGDGTVVLYESDATDIVAGDTNNASDVFRRTIAGLVTRISTTSSGGQADSDSFNPSVNQDGSVMAFASAAGNLVAGDTNNTTDVFIKLDTGATERVSVDDAGAEFPGYTLGADVDSSGDAIAMGTAPANVGGAGAGTTAIVRTRSEGRTDVAARDELGLVVATLQNGLAITGDGRYVALGSAAALVDDDTNSTSDAYLSDYIEPDITSVSPSVFPRGQTTIITVFGSGFRDSELFDNNNGLDLGIDYDSFTVLSANQIQAKVTVDANAPVGARNIWVQNLGTGPSTAPTGQNICNNCVTIS